MLFNSYEFIFLFLPITLIVYYAMAKKLSHMIAKYFLIFASVCFYSYWDVSNLPILLTSIFINYVFGYFLHSNPSKFILSLGVVFNLLFLGYFKYTDFVIVNINELLTLQIPLQEIALPLGISFFTFTQTAYLVDVYRGGDKWIFQERLSFVCNYFPSFDCWSYSLSQGYDSAVF